MNHQIQQRLAALATHLSRRVGRLHGYILILAVLVLLLPYTLKAQCEWTFYADSVATVIYGYIENGRTGTTVTAHFDVSREFEDEEGTKYIYSIQKDGATYPIPMGITSAGLVFYPYATLPTFRLCDTVGSLYMNLFVPSNSTRDSSSYYMQYLGLQPYYTLGKTRLCKVFLEYDVWYRDTITEQDTGIALDFYVWDIDSNGKPEIVIPLWYHILADSLGKIDEIDYHHGVHSHTVIGIWFGNRFVGDPLVGVAEAFAEPTQPTVRCRDNMLTLSGIPETDVGKPVTLHLYDLYGRLRVTRYLILDHTANLSIPDEPITAGDICAWVLRKANGSVSRGILMAE